MLVLSKLKAMSHMEIPLSFGSTLYKELWKVATI